MDFRTHSIPAARGDSLAAMNAVRIVLLAALAFCCSIGLAAAQWTDQQRIQFGAGCAGACQNNPATPVNKRDRCGNFCGCIVTEAQKFMTAADFDAANAAAARNQTTPMLERFRGLFAMCQQRVIAP
jgi:hypothetical protein